VITRRGSRETAFPFRIELPLPSGVAPSGAAALSPDGRTLVFASRAPSGQGTLLYQRQLDQLTSRPIAGSDNASIAAFSPDGRSIALVVDRRHLMRIPLDGGSP